MLLVRYRLSGTFHHSVACRNPFLVLWLALTFPLQPFIKSQITRSDIDHSLFHNQHIIECESTLSDDDA
jgi:hypothetical protein